jgi:hypothetical protein
VLRVLLWVLWTTSTLSLEYLRYVDMENIFYLIM